MPDTAPGLSRRLVDVTMFWSAAGGGVRRYLLSKRAWLKRHGWQPVLVAPGVRGPGMADCGGMRLPGGAGYRLPLRRALAAQRIVGEAPELIEAGDPYRLAWASLDAAARLGVPAVAFCHSNLAALVALATGQHGITARLARRAAERYLVRLYRAFDLVLAPSAALADELRVLGLGAVEQQPLGVDCQVFHPACRDPAWRASLGLSQTSRLLLYAGRFAPEKNLSLLSAAVDRLGPPYQLVAVGQGPRPPQGKRLVVLPYATDERSMARICASVDGALHAGEQETFGLSVLEAMAAGTPVAVRAAAGLGELVEGGAGVAVDSADPSRWAEAIVELFGAACEQRVAVARQRAEALDWTRVLPALAARYDRLLAERRERR